MHEYDTVLKALLQSPESTVLERITGVRIVSWLPVEFPEVQQTRVDLLGATADPNHLVAVELQSTNDPNMPLRMAEYALRAYRLYGAFPDQFVLYVGEPEMRMPMELIGPNFKFHYRIADIRMLDEDFLLNSPFDSDNVLAILARHRNRRETIRQILAKIATLEGAKRDDAFKKLMILAGLRHLGDAIRTEVEYMPILDDIMDHDLLGPAIRQGMQKGRQEGIQEGIQQGELATLRRQLTKRFGPLPVQINERLNTLSTTELEDLSLRLLDAQSLTELFPF